MSMSIATIGERIRHLGAEVTRRTGVGAARARRLVGRLTTGRRDRPA